ncbi:MAG: hypothetical protein ABW044_02240, partial [Cellvibrio sp.]
MLRVTLMHVAKPRNLLIFFVIIVSACGGGGGDKSGVSKSSSSASIVKLGGKITFDFVPHNLNFVGLNYGATESRPVRGAVVEILDNTNQIKASTNTAADGTYSVTVPQNIDLKVRVKAQLLKTSSPSWDFKVTDNTSNNALYVLEGALASTGSTNSIRNLHANSGWDGTAYTNIRSAAPFAILDSIYTGVIKLESAGNSQNLSPLELRWSTKNSTADGDYTKGEIETSFYDGDAIYILGSANNDTDEYDPHILLHEWAHYVEVELSRSDTIGGDHSDDAPLDMRVAMSEGFANAFSGMAINNPNYADALGVAQTSGFTFDIARKARSNKGYFSEGSIGSIFYNFYASSESKLANDFTPIFKILNSFSYYANDAMTSIYLFYAQLKIQLPEYSVLLQTLLNEQAIWGVDEYASMESNSGGLAIQLPVYKKLDVNNTPLNICSSNQYGEQNKLGNSQFIRVNILQAGAYTFNIVKSGGSLTSSNPEF